MLAPMTCNPLVRATQAGLLKRHNEQPGPDQALATLPAGENERKPAAGVCWAPFAALSFGQPCPLGTLQVCRPSLLPLPTTLIVS